MYMLRKIDLLKDKVNLYDNLAQYGDHKGRLSSSLEIFPSPKIIWEFEVIGEEVKEKGMLRTIIPIKPIEGIDFLIEEPFQSNDFHDFVTPMEMISGEAFRASIGNINNKANSFVFYLPNTLFHADIIFGQKSIERIYRIDGKEIGVDKGGCQIDAKIDDAWNVTLKITNEALSWLDRRNLNIGTKITTMGYLYSPQEGDTKFSDYPMLSTVEALDYVEKLSVLLSFVNGGYIGPLFLESRRFHDHEVDISEYQNEAIVLASKSTPLELLGYSWGTFDSDLSQYISCLPALKRMLSGSPWNDTLYLILTWYFQAIQPESRQVRSKGWPIVANALGAALERLSYTILVLEENDPTLREKNDALFSNSPKKAKKYWGDIDNKLTEKRLRLLLERIGLSLEKGFWDVNEVYEFLKIRNEATHPLKRDNIKDVNYFLHKAVQWVYEVLLWRLGYQGNYRCNTAPGNQSIPHRYDLSTRSVTW